jgi:hypothetical protein
VTVVHAITPGDEGMPAATGNRAGLANPMRLDFIILASKFFGFDFPKKIEDLFPVP